MTESTNGQKGEGERPQVVSVRGYTDAERHQLTERLDRVARALASGELVAFPTETVYGLGANATIERAVSRIFEAKQRPAGHPLIVHGADVEMMKRCAGRWPEVAGRLAERFWPGPMTLILERSDEIPEVVTGGLSTVGCRVPSHPVALALIDAAGVPVAAPSANAHQGVSPTTAEHVLRSLGNRIDWVVDAGPTRVGIESTVLDVTVSPPVILRPGAITRRQMMDVGGDALDDIEYADDVDVRLEQDDARPSPGLSETHYAPGAEVWLGTREALEHVRGKLAGTSHTDVPRVGWIIVGDERPEMVPEDDACEVLPGDPSAYASQLYAALHRLDDAGYTTLLVESPPDAEPWRAVRNRLGRAASRRV